MRRQQQAAREGNDSLGPEVLAAQWLPHPQGKGTRMRGDGGFIILIAAKMFQLVIKLYNSLWEHVQKYPSKLYSS